MTRCYAMTERKLVLGPPKAVNPPRCEREAYYFISTVAHKAKFVRVMPDPNYYCRRVNAAAVEVTALCEECMNLDRIFGTYRNPLSRVEEPIWSEEAHLLLGIVALQELAGATPGYTVHGGLVKAPAVGLRFHRLRISEMPAALRKRLKARGAQEAVS